ncbi:whirlin-like isoform X1 [Acropora palmata]|uniref:whirlin-like isoform X1 n=1 Tax=Acropora palmata TaxID=6131 RepID=UPI003DA1C13E
MEDIFMEQTSRKMSENVRELQSALTKVLKSEDRVFFIESLNQYQRDKNVNSLVVTLKLVLNTARKREVYPLLYQIIPHGDREIFHRLWHQGLEDPRSRASSKSPARSPRNLRGNPVSTSLPTNLQRYASDSGIDLPNMTQSHSSTDKKYPIKQLIIKRPSNSGFGFCIRGGAEHGVGLYVSSVDPRSVAENEGLLPGDHIVQVNGTKFDGLTHAQAVKVIKNSKKLNLFVRSVGRIPNSFVAESTCKWVDMSGRRVSPPPGVDSNGRFLSAGGIDKSDLRLLGDDDERKVNIFVEDGAKLGLLIRGGSDCGLGIYIAGVDVDGAADQAGLKAGDQILDVNGQSFLNISHKQAVNVLRSTKNMIVTLKDVGKLPFTRVTHDKMKWIKNSTKNGKINSVPDQVSHITQVEIHSPPGSSQQGQLPSSNRHHKRAGRKGTTEQSMFHHGIAGSQVLYNGGLPSQKNLIADQAGQILNENELGTLKYYLAEYSSGYISISAFALALFDLLNTPAKMSLMTEIRSSVEPKDIDRFDDLVLKKEIEIMKSGQFLGSHFDEDRHSIHSYASSVSSFSGKGSSSRSSAKGSLDDTGSRPITPPQVPAILPANVKVKDDINTDATEPYEVYEATLTFHDDNEQIFDEEEDVGLPSFLTIDPISLDLPRTEGTSPQHLGDNLSMPLLTSSPVSDQNRPDSPTKTAGETTTSESVGDNTRQKSSLLGRHGESSYANGENLPKDQQKRIQTKHRASQELYDLHQFCKNKDENTNRNEHLGLQRNTVTIETRESPRGRVKEIADSVFEVEVDKSSGSLGLTLEGGTDTAREIRINAIKEGNFAAWKCGRLKVGQAVLQVDGTPLTGMTSGKAFLTLRHAYSSSDSPVLKLLIRDI